jgi:mono/diheme cytochrome c family protein
MKSLSTGKTFLTQRTKKVAGPAFAKAGYNVENLVGQREILAAWANTLSDNQADDLLNYVTGKTPPADTVKADPSAKQLRVVK